MKRKTYYPENIEKKTNQFKVRKVETRKQYTETEITNMRFYAFWLGFISGIIVLCLICYLQEINVI